ncbi:DCC-interacting protein 13 alpha [Mytilus galloprovincialis]|uniref:DCC-interacting protein 13 alpha n=1 Tax=Mytilus galloprovincialis TaxID=29158 RepID=A0A8B6DV10_MYTGA|nr:DCC-interacting protein 13 alpha [Mytilus galloprovincialis]
MEAEISDIISKSLHLKGLGISKRIASIHRNHTHSIDQLFFAGSGEILRHYHGGSCAEGTSILESDLDKMMVVPGVIVCSDVDAIQKMNCHIFEMNSNNCRPGFTKLTPVHIENSEYDLFQMYQKNIREMLEKDERGNLWFSSEKFHQFLLSIPASIPPDKRALPTHYRHGPAATCEQTDSQGYIAGEPGTKIEIDYSHGLLMEEWPEEAKEWITRQRHYCWPGKALVEKISNFDCHLVPVGDKSSNHQHLEWRISFLLCELELVWSFSDIQIQLYFLLKQILKLEIESLYPDQLSSYHMKTAVYWYSETDDITQWTGYELLDLVKRCLIFVSCCIEKGELHHYFHRKRNLLFEKFIDAKGKLLVLNKINHLTETILPTVIKLLAQPHLDRAWTKCSEDPERFLGYCRSHDFLGPSFSKLRYKNELRSLFKQVFSVFVSMVESKIETLRLQSKYFETKKTSEIDEDFFYFLIQFLDLRLGISFQKESMKDQNRIHIEMLRKDAEVFILKGTELDALSGYLYLATFYLNVNKTEMAVKVLKTLIMKHNDASFIYPGWCSQKKGIKVSSSICRQIEGPFIQEDTCVNNAVGFDVIFSADDVSFVPDPVKFECILVQNEFDDFIVIHPVVYMYFMMTITFYKSGNLSKTLENLQKLDTSVNEAKGGMQRFRALNLLGYCNFLVERFNSAYKYYIASIEETYTFGEPLVLETMRQIMAARAIHNVFRMTESRLVVSSDNMKLIDPSTNIVRTVFALADISFWAAHNENKRLFGFITRNRQTGLPNPSFACHVFECNVSAEEICSAIQTATKLAFQALMEKKAVEKIQKVKAKEKNILLQNIQNLEDADSDEELNKLPLSPDGKYLVLTATEDDDEMLEDTNYVDTQMTQKVQDLVVTQEEEGVDDSEA